MRFREIPRPSPRVLLGLTAAIAALLAPATADAAGTGTIEGEISGPGGAHVAEAWACAYHVHSAAFEETCVPAGGDGTYAIPGLEAGEYKVEFWSESTQPSYVGEFYDDKRRWEEADEIAVEEGAATSGIDAELAEAATIEGRVDAASVGGPVEEAVVCAQLLTGEPVGCALDRPDGTYTLSGLPAGEYKIQFIPAFPRYNLLNQFYDHRGSFAEADPLVVAGGETQTGIDADLEAGAEIRGTVYSAATRAPLAGISVCALAVEEGGTEWLLRECVPTSAAGSYALVALTTDSYKVAFSPELKEFFAGGEGFGSEDDGYLTQYFDEKPTLAAADPLALAVPEVRTGIDAHLRPERLTTAHSGSFAPPAPESPAPTRKHCRSGFRRKKVGGKPYCLRLHIHHHHHHHHRRLP